MSKIPLPLLVSVALCNHLKAELRKVTRAIHKKLVYEWTMLPSS